MGRFVSSLQMEQENEARSSRINFAEALLDITPRNTARRETRVRLIGIPFLVWEALPEKRLPDGKTVHYPFPDAHINKFRTRYCNDDFKNDYWTQQGYVKRRKYAITVINRADGKAYILTRGKKFFDFIFETEKFNRNLNATQNEKLWECAGGEIAPDLVIIGKKTGPKDTDVEYSLQFMPTPNKITEEEIEMLRSMYEPTPEELKKMKGDLDVPDWYFYGYNLPEIFKPMEPKFDNVETNTTEPSETEINLTQDFITELKNNIDEVENPVETIDEKTSTTKSTSEIQLETKSIKSSTKNIKKLTWNEDDEDDEINSETW